MYATLGNRSKKRRAKRGPFSTDDLLCQVGALHNKLGPLLLDVPNLARPVRRRRQENVRAEGVTPQLVTLTLYTAPV